MELKNHHGKQDSEGTAFIGLCNVEYFMYLPDYM